MGVVAAIVGSALLGAAGSAYKANEEKKAAKKQERRLDKQESQAKLEARNKAALSEKEETGAEILLGRDGEATKDITNAGRGGGTSRKGSVKSRVGGLSNAMPKQSSSKRIGL